MLLAIYGVGNTKLCFTYFTRKDVACSALSDSKHYTEREVQVGTERCWARHIVIAVSSSLNLTALYPDKSAVRAIQALGEKAVHSTILVGQHPLQHLQTTKSDLSMVHAVNIALAVATENASDADWSL